MNYYVRRIGQAVLTLFIVLTISFVMFRMLPGNPVDRLVSVEFRECVEASGAGACDIQSIRQSVEARLNIDPDKSIPRAYIDYFTNIIINQDFGTSTQYQDPAFQILFQALPWSVFISLYGLAFGFAFNIFLGAAMAYNEGSLFDKIATIFAMVGNATPYYVAAILALSFFAFELGLFPTGGRRAHQLKFLHLGWGTVFGVNLEWLINEPDIKAGFNPAFMLGVLWHASLPIFTGFVLGISGLGMRANAIRIMGSDYLRVARLRGLSQSRIASRYVARNAVLPIYTGFMIGIAGIFSSGIITERIFTYPAVGWYTFRAVIVRDYPLMMASFLFYTTITILGILLADFTYSLIDPRATTGDDHESF